jgi:hypothetical protein
VHWSQSVSWLLLSAGYIRHIALGEDLYDAIERAAVWVGPSLYFILISSTGILILRRLGALVALIWMLNLLALPSVEWSFHPLRPDHHGLQLGFLIGSLMCLVFGGLGWTSTTIDSSKYKPAWFSTFTLPDTRNARKFFIASGIFGGLGFWTGASVQIFGIVLFCAGALVLVLCLPPNFDKASDPLTTYEPRLWRWWAFSGSTTALAFYFIEYAPNFPGMRLEANHPLYALFWLCLGEILFRLSEHKTGRRKANVGLLLVMCMGAGLLPVFLLFGPSEWHSMRDPFMQRVHEFIDEFLPYQHARSGSSLLRALNDFGFLPIFLLIAPFWARDARTQLHEWGALWMLFLPASVYAGLTLWQARWTNFFGGACLLLAVFTLAVIRAHTNRKLWTTLWLYFCIALFVAPNLYSIRMKVLDLKSSTLSGQHLHVLLPPILQRQLAQNLASLSTSSHSAIMSPPSLAVKLYYYGGHHAVASYYWENAEGLRAAVDFFAAINDEEARQIAQERAITHIVLPPAPSIVRMFSYVKHGDYIDIMERKSLAGRMLFDQQALPSWIQRDIELEKNLQPGYVYNNVPIVGSLLVFLVNLDNSPEASE